MYCQRVVDNLHGDSKRRTRTEQHSVKASPPALRTQEHWDQCEHWQCGFHRVQQIEVPAVLRSVERHKFPGNNRYCVEVDPKQQQYQEIQPAECQRSLVLLGMRKHRQGTHECHWQQEEEHVANKDIWNGEL